MVKDTAGSQVGAHDIPDCCLASRSLDEVLEAVPGWELRAGGGKAFRLSEPTSKFCHALPLELFFLLFADLLDS